MRKTTTLAVLSALILALVPLLALALPPPAAAAARVVAPPGNSEADQYFETLPASAGPRSPDSTKTAQDAVREGTLAAATERALQRRGAAGQAVANVVAKTAPAGKPGGGGRAGGPSGPATAAGAGAPEKQGLGALFPLILAATAGGALAFAVARRRRSVAR